MPADAEWLERHRRSFGSRPIRVLAAKNHYHDDDMTPPALHSEHFAIEHDWRRAQHRLLSLSSNPKQIIVRDSGHFIQFDRAKVVSNAIVGELHEHWSLRSSRTRIISELGVHWGSPIALNAHTTVIY